MNRHEYLVTCLMEECAEVQHVCGKILRFGLHDRSPSGLKEENIVELLKEMVDIVAIFHMLAENIGNSDLDSVYSEMRAANDFEAKMAKVEKYMQYSKDRGCLID